MSNYKEIFDSILSTIINNSRYPKEVVLSRFKRFMKFNFDDFDEEYLYSVLAYVPFYAGMDSKIVTDKRGRILEYFNDYRIVANYNDEMVSIMLSDPNMIKHEGKIRANIYNAGRVVELSKKYGSFKNYLISLNFNKDANSLEIAAAKLQNEFKWLGDVTVHHFLTDIGANTIKPDRVIMRVLTRLNLIGGENNFEQARNVCNDFVLETGYSHRYIDIVMVKFGHRKDDMDTGIIDGICLEDNPKCNLCSVKKYCSYQKPNPTKVNDSISMNTLINSVNNKVIKNNSSINVLKFNSSYTYSEFIESDIFKKYDFNVQNLLKYLMLGINSLKINYMVKVRGDNAVVLTLKNDIKKNIITVWPRKSKIDIKVLNKEDRSCLSTKDLDDSLFRNILFKYEEVVK